MDTTIANNSDDKNMYERFMDYCRSQEHKSTLWFFFPLITLAGAIMPASITSMYIFDLPGFLPYVAIIVTLFFLNLVLHVSEMKTTITIPIFLLTVVINIAYPLIAFLFTL